MPDVQLRTQVVESPAVAFGPDRAEVDLWFRENFPVPGQTAGISFYPTRWGVDTFAAAGPATRTLALAGIEAADVASLALTLGHPLALAASESTDVAAFALTLGHPFSFAISEPADVAAFAVDVAGPSASTPEQPAVGSARRHGVRFRREFVIGDKRYIVESDGELERMLVERIQGPVRVARVPKSVPAIPVNAGSAEPLVEWGPFELPNIDWSAVEALREQSQRLHQTAVLEAIQRIVRVWKARQDDEDDEEALLLL